MDKGEFSLILGEVKGINCVLLDLTPKPTETIEWENICLKSPLYKGFFVPVKAV